MNYYSLNRQSPAVSFREATIRGQAPDKGLYFPSTIAAVKSELISNIETYSNVEIAFEVISPYVQDNIPAGRLFEICRQAVDFPIPLIKIHNQVYSLELFHGPTLAFKDIGARFMSRCLGYFVEEGIQGLNESGKITVLVATSGDTGGAVASGFYEVEGVEVIILYPSGKVSPVQEKQLTALGKNIHALEVEGSFDDCQALVKRAFGDAEITKQLFLTSANSINIARWLPQQFYYFFAYKQWPDKLNPPVISVPSGNFGNICAGILAMESGLPVPHFIAACNTNNIVTEYLKTGRYITKPAMATLSNAMDVGDPSNFVRIMEIFHQQYPELIQKISSYSISDSETLAVINEVYSKYNYILDPHGAVGYACLSRYQEVHDQPGIFIETAHPVKFPGAVESATGVRVEIPADLKSLMEKEKKSVKINPDYSQFKDWLLSKS